MTQYSSNSIFSTISKPVKKSNYEDVKILISMAFDIWFYLTWLNSLIKVLEQFILSKSELIFTLLFNESWKTVFLPWIFSMVIKLSAGEIWTQFGRNKDRVFWYIGSQPSITWKAMVVGTYQAFSWCEENMIYNIIHSSQELLSLSDDLYLTFSYYVNK